MGYPLDAHRILEKFPIVWYLNFYFYDVSNLQNKVSNPQIMS